MFKNNDPLLGSSPMKAGTLLPVNGSTFGGFPVDFLELLVNMLNGIKSSCGASLLMGVKEIFPLLRGTDLFHFISLCYFASYLLWLIYLIESNTR